MLEDVVVGVAVPEDGAVDDDSFPWLVIGMVAIISAMASGSCSDLGFNSCRVAESSSLSSPTVLEGSSCFPPWMSRTSAGSVVEADKNSRRLEMV